ncbi:hypothetical protein DSAG12_01012 [Promethearchaeum syntrophicum]|uniref:Uncharacterized protein n=1 Tax=Promethearchaeum syntrophicum TaxID=2594042 RepID=A0A5B9D7K7_9ARCH|nr:hypothetical protein [Candidatus Prometheoarchaeum syntrophicum]
MGILNRKYDIKSGLDYSECEIIDHIAKNVDILKIRITKDKEKVKGITISDKITTETFKTICLFSKLTYLNITEGSVDQIPSDIAILTELDTIVIKDYRGGSIPPEIGKLSKLTRLEISSNIENSERKKFKIPSTISNLKSLKIAKFSHINFQEFPIVLCKCSDLQQLSLISANIKTIPPCIEQLSDLIHLFLSSNRITTLPKELQKLLKLKVLMVDQNNIKEIPDWIGNLPSLYSFKIDNNCITELPKLIIKKLIGKSSSDYNRHDLQNTFINLNLSNPWKEPLNSLIRWKRHSHPYSRNQKHRLTFLDLDKEIIRKCKQKSTSIKFSLEEFTFTPFFPNRQEILDLLEKAQYDSNHHVRQMYRDIKAQIRWEKRISKNIKKVKTDTKTPEEIPLLDNLQNNFSSANWGKIKLYQKAISSQDYDTLKSLVIWEKDLQIIDNAFIDSIKFNDFQAVKIFTDLGIPIRLLIDSIIRLYYLQTFRKKKYPVIKKLLNKYESVHLISQDIFDILAKNEDMNLKSLVNLAVKQQYIDNFIPIIENAEIYKPWMKKLINYMISNPEYRGFGVEKFTLWAKITQTKLQDNAQFVQEILDFLKENDSDSYEMISKALKIGSLSIPELIAKSEKSFSSGVLSIIKQGNLSHLKQKLAASEDPSQDMNMAFRWAVKWGRLDIIKYLVEEQNVNIHANDDEALKLSLDFCHILIAKFLLKQGAKVKDPIMYIDAILERGENEFIKYIFEKEQIRKNNFEQFLFKCIFAGNVEMLIFCEQRGGSIPILNKFDCRRLISSGHVKMLEFLRQNKKIEHLEYDKATLYAHILQGNFAMVRFLIENKENLEYSEKEALRSASKSGNSEIFQYFIMIGADPSQIEFNPQIYPAFIYCIEQNKFPAKVRDSIIQWMNTASVAQKRRYLPKMRQYLEAKIQTISSPKKQNLIQQIITAVNQELKVFISDDVGIFL